MRLRNHLIVVLRRKHVCCANHTRSIEEQYDPTDLASTAVSQPFAYVADLVEEVKLGVDIDEVRGRGLNNEQWTAIMELRDKLAPEENVGWYIVVCGDEERLFPPTADSVQGSANSRAVTPEKPNETPVKAAAAVGTESPGGKLHKQKPQTPPEKDKAESKGLLGKLLGSARLKRPKR